MFELAGYRVLETIENGGEIVLCRVERLSDGRRLLAKALIGSAADADAAATLYQEYERLLGLQGRGGVEPEGVELQGTRSALLLPDNGETTLARAMRAHRDSMKLEQLLERAVSMADSLSQLHRAGLMLHVLTPSSILLGDSEARLLDVRYASSIDSAAGSFWEGRRSDWGLPYLAPEQTGRTGRTPDIRSDLYSLGVILYEWFAGTYPYPADDTIDLVYHHLAANPEPAWRRNASVPRTVSDIVQKCMEKMPEARYADAAGIRADLEECLLQLRVTGKVQPFPLGELDRPQRRASEERLSEADKTARHEAKERENTVNSWGASYSFVPQRIGLRLLERKIRSKLKRLGAEAIRKLPVVADPQLRADLAALAKAIEVDSNAESQNRDFSTLTLAELTLKHGWTPESVVGLTNYVSRYEDHPHQETFAEEWSKQMQLLADEEPGMFAQAAASLAASEGGWRRFGLRERIALTGKAVRAALLAGRTELANRCLLIHCRLLLQAGHPLRDIYTRLLLHAGYFRQEGSERHWRQAAEMAGFISELTGYRASEDPYVGANVKPNADEGFRAAGTDRVAERLAASYSLVTDCLLGKSSYQFAAPEQSLQSSRAQGYLLPFDIDFYSILLWKETCGQGNGRERAETARRMHASLRRLAKRAELRPETEQHKYLLARAELASLKPDSQRRAELWYEQAIELARQAGYGHEAGIGAECYARYGLRTGRSALAKVYLNEARDRFRSWGATAKTNDMEAKYGEWLNGKMAAGLGQIDHLSVILSARSLSSEMEMERLLQVLVHIMLQNAGAEYGALLINREGRWIVEAHGTIDALRIEPIPLEEAGQLIPAALVAYSASSMEEIVVQDAADSELFERSGQAGRTGIRSALCLPVLYQNRLIGLLYLENNLSTGVFTEKRLEVLRLLASQGAVALTNASLYSGIQHLKNHLEEQVEERTRKLELSMLAVAEAQAEMKVYAERNRIAQEIHDIVGHTLTSTVLQIEAGKRLMNRDLDRSLERFNEAQGLVRHSLNEIRNSVHMLKEDKYYDLEEALLRLIRETERNAGVTIRASIDPVPSATALHKKTIYHALQEGLTNGIRHGKCGQFRFLLQDRGSWLEFELEDDGMGVEQLERGFGLKTMDERVRQLKGSLALESAPGQGCVLRIQMPY